jgi:hypothetical protein
LHAPQCPAGFKCDYSDGFCYKDIDGSLFDRQSEDLKCKDKNPDDCLVVAYDSTKKECKEYPVNSLCKPGEYCTKEGKCLISKECIRDSDCDDGIYCNGKEQCKRYGEDKIGYCKPGSPPECKAPEDCGIGAFCDEKNKGKCRIFVDHRKCNAGEFCDEREGCKSIPEYILGYWRMDGNWNDSTLNSNHGFPIGESKFTPDSKVGSHAGVFDGNGDYIDLPSKFSLQVFSIEAWINPQGENKRAIFGYANKNGYYGYIFYIDSGSKLSFDCVNQQGSSWQKIKSKNNVPNNKWSHVVVVVDEGSISLYVNGVKEETKEKKDPLLYLLSSQMSASIARANPRFAYASYYNGKIDNLIFYKKALSESEIKERYFRTK